MLQTSQQVLDRSDNLPPDPLLAKAIQHLQEISSDFSAIAEDCSHQHGKKQGKINRTKWILKDKKIQKLHQKAKNARERLQFAISCHFGNAMQYGYVCLTMPRFSISP